MLNVSIVHRLNTRRLQWHFKEKLWHLWVDFRFCYGLLFLGQGERDKTDNKSQKIWRKAAAFRLRFSVGGLFLQLFAHFCTDACRMSPVHKALQVLLDRTSTNADKLQIQILKRINKTCANQIYINTTNESFLNVISLLCIFSFITCLSFHLHYPT